MKILVEQLSPKIADLRYNERLIMQAYVRANALNCDVCLLPELCTTGYIPKDLLFNGDFIADLQSSIDSIINKCHGKAVLLLSTAFKEEDGLYNAVIAIHNGKVIGKTAKCHLANYGMFDEKRYFKPSREPHILEITGRKIGVPICEDIWFPDVIEHLKQQGAEIILVPNASPFELDKKQKRMQIATQRYAESKLPIVYCNQAMAHDGVVYDGGSFCYDGATFRHLQSFAPDQLMIEFSDGGMSCNDVITSERSKLEEVYGALVYATQGYVDDSGFKRVIIGLSGGIDSALVAAIAVDALGAENVKTYMLKSIFTSTASVSDAYETALLLGVQHTVLDIMPSVNAIESEILELSALAKENLQARIRGTMLMSLANSSDSLLLTTGNKSEIATGYCTLYGDMCGAFNPIGDIYKTQVFELAAFRNQYIPSDFGVIRGAAGPVMAANIMTKEPSAELREGQRDSDSLSPYPLLDRVLELHLEQGLSAREIIALGYADNVVCKILKLVRTAEYKRRQGAPAVKISSRSFGLERRYPILEFSREMYG